MTRDSPVLDTLRATAVLLVLGAHTAEVLAVRATIDVHPWDWHIGRLGVLLFFVHTSLVLLMSLARTPIEGAALVQNFYVRRAFRIYPLAMLTVLTVSLAGIPQVPWGEPVDITPSVLASNLLLVQNLTDAPSVLMPLWSLPLEIQMYLVLPLVFVATRGGRRLSVAALLWLAAALAGSQVPADGTSLAPFVPCFLSGVIAYCVSQRRTRELPFWLFGVVLGAGVLSYLALSAPDPSVHSRLAAWSVCLAVGLLLPQFRDTSSRLVRRGAAWIAQYSYGIYVSHQIALWLAFVMLPDLPLAVNLGLFAVLMAVVPVALYHTIEAPLIRQGGMCAAWLSQPAAGPGPVEHQPTHIGR